MTPEKQRNFERLLTPRHIAFVGGADAALAIGEARRAGYAGQMWVVNPKRAQMAGLPCLPDLSALPEAPDAVFLAIPAPAVPGAIATLRDMGAGGIACYSAGFGEAHEDGAALERQLKDNLGDMVLIGPNCYGLINYIGKSALWPFAHGGSSPGYGAAIITQSGMFSSDITMSQRSLPLAYMASAGNQADLGLAEFVELFCDRPEVRAIGVHIEGLSNVPAFERAALKAAQAGTPIVALKTGTSEIGERLTLSHTGSLAGSAALYQALFDRVGIISVTNPSQFLETLKFLCVVKAPEGRAMMGFTASGGGATMLADHAERIGLSLPAPDTAAHTALTALLPPIATMSNPLDYTTPIWGQPEKTEPVFAEAMQRIAVDAAILVQDYPAEGLDESEPLYLNDGLAFARAARTAGVSAVICATIPENIPAHIRACLIAEGVAPMQGIHEALNAISAAAWWRRAQLRIVDFPPAPLLPASSPNGARMLTEAEGKALLSKAGLPVPKGRVVPRCGLNAAAAEVGYPVALKMMSEALAHKTEAGAVALGLSSMHALDEAATVMQDSVRNAAPGALRDAFLVEAMGASPLVELVVAIRRDAQFGLALTLGSGGLWVDLLRDTTSVLLPAQDAEIDAALDLLKVSRVLDGFRGAPPVDRKTLIAAIQRLASFAIAHARSVVEIEINPLFVYQNHVLAIDALIQVTDE